VQADSQLLQKTKAILPRIQDYFSPWYAPTTRNSLLAYS
jgi:hypothetical protein